MKKLFNTLPSTAIGDKVVCSCQQIYMQARTILINLSLNLPRPEKPDPT